MVRGCLEGEYINRHAGVHTKSGTLLQTKSEKSPKRYFPPRPPPPSLSFSSHEVLFAQGGCRAARGIYGRGERLSHPELMHKWTVVMGREWWEVVVGIVGVRAGQDTRWGEEPQPGILCGGLELIT